MPRWGGSRGKGEFLRLWGRTAKKKREGPPRTGKKDGTISKKAEEQGRIKKVCFWATKKKGRVLDREG